MVATRHNITITAPINTMMTRYRTIGGKVKKKYTIVDEEESNKLFQRHKPMMMY